MIQQALFAKGQTQYKWINIDSDSIQEDSIIYDQYEIDEEIVEYALDKNERAHIEYDSQSETFILIFNVPQQNKIDNHYETVPMTFIVKNNRLITISNHENNYIVAALKKSLAKAGEISLYKFLFTSLFTISEYFFPLVEEMNRDRQRISHLLKEKTTKKNLLGLSDLETGIVYFVAAAKQNALLLEQVKKNEIYRQLDELEKEQLEDSLIEAKQLMEMTQLASEILT